MSLQKIKSALEVLEDPRLYRNVLIGVFLVCFVYWGYLAASSQINVVHDAQEYHALGEVIYAQGWKEFLRTGPHREPLYPAAIAVSMRLADVFQTSYQTILKIIQVSFLLITQLLMLFLLNKLRIKNALKIITLFYFGFSPAVVNAAMSMFSEIIVFPFVLIVLISFFLFWREAFTASQGRVLLLSLMTSVSMAAAFLGKGVFQYVFLLFLLVFVFRMSAYRKGLDRKFLRNTLVYVFISFLIFNLVSGSYKYLNKKYNGHYQSSKSYPEIFWSSAAKRADPLTPRMFMAHLSTIPGMGVCKKFFKPEECRYCDWYGASDYRYEVLPGLLKGVPKELRTKKIFQMAFKEIGGNPVKYLLFTAIESAKMSFWESTQIGFVNYPGWLTKIYASVIFKNGLRFFISLLTVIALVFVLYDLLRHRAVLMGEKAEEARQLILLILIFILFYTGLYALCVVVTRYALPIASLYLLCIGYFLQKAICFDNRLD